MSQETIRDLVIVGAGPAGLAAGIYAKRAALDVVLYEESLAGGQMNITAEIENYPGFKRVGGAELSGIMAEHAADYGLDPVSVRVESIQPSAECHTLLLHDGGTVKSHAVILATGGRPRKLGVPGELENYGRGVSYCATCDGFFFRQKVCVVVGGGDTAVEEALYLAKLASKVYLVHRRDSLRAGRILQQRLFEEPKVEILWDSTINQIISDSSGVTGVLVNNLRSDSQQNVATDGVFIFVGFMPNNQLVPEGVKLSASGQVVTDQKCESTISGLFAVGDLREKYAQQVVLSAADGCTAALAAASYVEAKKATCRIKAA